MQLSLPLSFSGTKTTRAQVLRYVFCFALLGITCLIAVGGLDFSRVPVTDYVAYWSASRLLITGQNPYEPAKVLALERTAGPVPGALVMRNPPWALPLVLPLGLFAYSSSRILWLFAELFIVMGSALWFWRIYEGAASQRWIAGLIAFSFLPSLWVLFIGQITPFILLGIAGFLYCEISGRANSWMQAASLVLVALKPQLLYLFWIALLLVTLYRPRHGNAARTEWTLLLKFTIALLAAVAIPLIIDPKIVSEYGSYVRQTPILQERISTIGSLLWQHSNLRWTQFAPMFAGTIWVLWYWFRNRKEWNWSERIPALLLLSVITTSYSYFFDQVVLLPAILLAMARVSRRARGLRTISALLLYFAVSGCVLGIFSQNISTPSFRFAFVAPLWGLLFLLLLRMARLPQEEPIPNSTAERECETIAGTVS